MSSHEKNAFKRVWLTLVASALLLAALSALAGSQSTTLQRWVSTWEQNPPAATSALVASVVLLVAALVGLVAHLRQWQTAAERGLPQPSAVPRLDLDDTLTGLSNRDTFLRHHLNAVAQANAAGGQGVMLCFDVERLKTMNALLGFEAGDQAIAWTGERAGSQVAKSTHLARLGGGTFAAWLVLPKGTADTAAPTPLQRARAFRTALQQTRPWRSHRLDLQVTVGVAASPEHGETAAELLRRAEQALFEAKRSRAVVGIYSPAIEAARLVHLGLAHDLQKALEASELQTLLQPRWCTRSRQVVGAKALVRWHHPRRGQLLPVDFIAFAERTGRIGDVTQLMLNNAAKLLNSELAGLHLSVNVSVVDLRDPALVPALQDLLHKHHLEPARLRLEVTEKTLLENGGEALSRLAELRALGLGVAIDDFGTGASPLAQLQRLPATELKIDRSYVVDVDSNPGRQQLLQTIIDMAHNLELVVTAKGVETEGERDALVAMGCDVLQGSLIGRPVSAEEFVRLHSARQG